MDTIFQQIYVSSYISTLTSSVTFSCKIISSIPDLYISWLDNLKTINVLSHSIGCTSQRYRRLFMKYYIHLGVQHEIDKFEFTLDITESLVVQYSNLLWLSQYVWLCSIRKNLIRKTRILTYLNFQMFNSLGNF